MTTLIKSPSGGKSCDFYVVDNRTSLMEWVPVLESYDTLAFDTETYVVKSGGTFTDPYSCKVRLIQVGFHDRDPLIVDVKALGEDGEDGDDSAVTGVLELLSNKVLVAHNAPYDYKQVKVSLGVSLGKIVCTKVAMQTLALASGYKAWRQRNFSYLALCRDLLGVRVDKTLQVSDWGNTLTNEQYEYAALDVGAPHGRKGRSLLLQAYNIMKKASTSLGMDEVWDLRQALVPIVGDMELHGLLLDGELLGALGYAVREQVSTSTYTLCNLLGLEVVPTMSDDGSWETTLTPTPASAKLLNHKAGLLKHINKALSKDGVELTDLQEDTLKPHQSIPLVSTLMRYTMYHKLLSDVKKYQEVTNPHTGRVHFHTNIVGTSTGRMSGSSEEGSTSYKLSIQQMSGKVVKLRDGRNTSLRGCVMAGPGSVLMDLDFSGQELRIAAALSRDKVMLDTYMLERDNPYQIHPDTGEQYLNPMTDLHLVATMAMAPYAYLKDLPLWEVMKVAKIKGPDGTDPRSKGKTFNFSVVYGASANSVAEDLGVSPKEADIYLKDYFRKFSGLKRWLDAQAKQATDLRWLQLPMGAQIFSNEVNAKGSGDRGAISRRAGNIPIQGTGAIMMALAIKYQRERLGRKLKHLAFIYDGMLCEVPLPKGEEAKDSAGNWNPYILDIFSEAKQCLLDAEDHILSPYIGEPFPCAVDGKISIHWEH